MNEPDLDRWLSQLRKGSLEMVVLATLADERLYGLEILGRLEALGVAEGTLYPLLNRLHKEGRLESEWETRATGHPRRYYQLTDSGRARAEEMALRWKEYNHQLEEMMRPLLEGGTS